jgi:hypothetical protein
MGGSAMGIKVWRRLVMMAIVGLGLTVASGAQAQTMTWTSWGYVTWLVGGWSQDTIAAGHTAPLVNPGNVCKTSNAGYATDPADPGHSLFHTMLLSSFMNKKEVRFLLQGCVYDKPKIIAVEIH